MRQQFEQETSAMVKKLGDSEHQTMLVAMYHHVSVAGLSIPYLELSAIYAVTFFFFLINESSFSFAIFS